MKKFLLLFVILFNVIFAQVKLGTFVGGVTETSAVFVVKTYSEQFVAIEIISENDEEYYLTDSIKTLAENYYFVKIRIDSLLPDTKYFYRAIVEETPSQRWHSFTTFPDEKNYSFSFGFGSCQQSGYSKWNPEVFPIIANDEISFFIQLGDWTYPDSTEENLGFTYNAKMDLLEKSYESKYDYNYPFVYEIMSQMPVMYVYDDHDFAANNSDGTNLYKQNTIEAYKKFFPHYQLGNPDNGIWQKFTFGDVDFFILDLRAQRNKNETALDENENFNPPPGHSILAGFDISGTNQKEWFLSELKNSDAKWKVIVSSVIFNPGYRKVIDNKIINEKYDWMKYDVIDKWAGFPEDIEAVMNTIKENDIKNVIVISGDTHSSYIDDGTNSLIPEISVSNLDVDNSHLNEKLQEGGINIWDRGFYDGNGHTYGRVSFIFDENEEYAVLDIIDESGEVVVSYEIDKK